VKKLFSLRTVLLAALTLPGLLAGCASGPVQAGKATRQPLSSATPTVQVTMPEVVVTAAANPSPAAASGQATSAPQPQAATPQPVASSAAPAGGQAPDDWRTLPVIPVVSDRARAIYQSGLSQGNHAHAFSKIGDCESQAIWYLTDFDRGPGAYSLGPYGYLQPVIDYFPASFGRVSIAAKSSFNAASLMNPLWSDHAVCQPDESPLACEVRIWRPGLALVMLGTNDSPRPANFEGNLRKDLDYLLSQGVLPVLATKADNLEGDGSINATIARLAAEYDIPLWNYWKAMQPLPNHGLLPDGAHLTNGPNRFDDPHAMQSGWAIRNLTALQALDAVWRGVTQK
jgi:hypothetical protein